MATVYGRPACQLILPPSAAKSLLKALEEALKDYEARTGNELLNLEELAIQMSTKK
jgi:hypothetical protein